MGILYGFRTAVIESATPVGTDDIDASPVASSITESLVSTPTSLCSAFSHPSECDTIDPESYNMAKAVIRRARRH